MQGDENRKQDVEEREYTLQPWKKAHKKDQPTQYFKSSLSTSMKSLTGKQKETACSSVGCLHCCQHPLGFTLNMQKQRVGIIMIILCSNLWLHEATCLVIINSRILALIYIDVVLYSLSCTSTSSLAWQLCVFMGEETETQSFKENLSKVPYVVPGPLTQNHLPFLWHQSSVSCVLVLYEQCTCVEVLKNCSSACQGLKRERKPGMVITCQHFRRPRQENSNFKSRLHN